MMTLTTMTTTMTMTMMMMIMIASKMEDDDVSGAIRLLHSEDKPVYDSDDIYQKLIDHHLQIPLSRILFNDSRYTNALQISEKDVLLALRSFPAGSSGGRGSLRSKHLLDLCNCKATRQSLLTAISSLINLLLEDKSYPNCNLNFIWWQFNCASEEVRRHSSDCHRIYVA